MATPTTTPTTTAPTPAPGSKQYQIRGVRIAASQNAILVDIQLFIVDSTGKSVSTGLKTIRVGWDAGLFATVTGALAAKITADPALAGASLVGG